MAAGKDEHWKFVFGIPFAYSNQDDARLWVPDYYDRKTTMNHGHPRAADFHFRLNSALVLSGGYVLFTHQIQYSERRRMSLAEFKMLEVYRRDQANWFGIGSWRPLYSCKLDHRTIVKRLKGNWHSINFGSMTGRMIPVVFAVCFAPVFSFVLFDK